MATGENKYDTWFWISKVIASCKSIYHINACEKLIYNFSLMYSDYLLCSKLRAELEDKIQELIELK
jgi:hypothetical protein